MKKYSFSLITIFLVFLIASCSQSNLLPPKLTDKIPPQNVIVKVLWHKKIGNSKVSASSYNIAPAYKNNAIFVPNKNGHIYALNITNGQVLWERTMKTNLSSPANTIANAVILGSIKGDLIALDIKTGLTLWHSHASSSLFAQPTLFNSFIYTHTHDGSVASFNAKNGLKKWNVTNNIPEITLPSNSSPVVLNNTVMIGSEFGAILGFEVNEGNRIIDIPIVITKDSSSTNNMKDISANPILYSNYLIFASYQGAIVALDKYNGKILWIRKSSIVHNMALNNNVIFTVQDNSTLKSFDIRNGNTIWINYTLKWCEITAPKYYKGLIVVGDIQGYLHFFDSKNGEYLGNYKLTPRGKIFNYGISTELIPTEKGIIVQAENDIIYLIDVHSEKVSYDTILSDHKVDRGSEINHILPV